jgi:hypothetical protein
LNTILKILVAGCLVFGFHYGVKRLAATAVSEQIGEYPRPIKVEVDPAALQRSLEIGRAAQPNPAARAVIEGAQRRIDDLNRTMPRH